MSVEGRDVIFTFDRSCNSKCCLWSRCSRELEDDDPVYVTPRGMVRKFDYGARGGANANAAKTLQNIQNVLRVMSEDRQKLEAIKLALEVQMNLSLEPVSPHIINAQQVKRIEEIALPIIRAPSPRMDHLQPPPNTPSHSDAVIEDYWPKTPKKGQRPQSNLVRSPEMRDIRLDLIEKFQEAAAIPQPEED